MARWQRDPEARRKVSWLLAAAETLALTFCSAFIVMGYVVFLASRFAGGALSPRGCYWVTIVATAIVLAAAVYEGMMFVRGRPWARRAYLIENGIVIGLGLLWFIKNRVTGDPANTTPAYFGLVIPMLTLFPLLWPLLVFSPKPQAPPAASGQP
jgi:hypothetical protein